LTGGTYEYKAYVEDAAGNQSAPSATVTLTVDVAAPTQEVTIKAVTDKSLQEYINYLRLEEARRLLDSATHLTLEAIAVECGFNSYSTFYRLFREQYQITPASYRKLAETT
jgi:transcriptional regulator GlxA family with amidase domain